MMGLAIEKMIETSEMTFLSDISEREVHRLREENLLPMRSGAPERRLFHVIDLVLANFYFKASESLSKSARLEAMRIFADRFEPEFNKNNLADLAKKKLDWKIQVGQLRDITIDFKLRVAEVAERLAALEKANKLVSDKGEFDDEPVFKGTRVPVSTVASLVVKGSSIEEITKHFPTVTTEMIDAAPLWVRAHPSKGRPRKFNEINPDWVLKSSEEIELVRS